MLKEVKPSHDSKVIKLLTFNITFSRQNDAGSRVSNTQYWENLALVVVLVSESKALYLWAMHSKRISLSGSGVLFCSFNIQLLLLLLNKRKICALLYTNKTKLAKLWFRRRLVSSVGRVPVCWAESRGFKSRPDQHSGSLIDWEESAAFVVTSANG